MAKKELQRRISNSVWYSSNTKPKTNPYLSDTATGIGAIGSRHSGDDQTLRKESAGQISSHQQVEELETLEATRVPSTGSQNSGSQKPASTKPSLSQPYKRLLPQNNSQDDDQIAWQQLGNVKSEFPDPNAHTVFKPLDDSHIMPNVPQNTINSFVDEGILSVKNLEIPTLTPLDNYHDGKVEDDMIGHEEDWQEPHEEHLEEEEENHGVDLYGLPANVSFHKNSQLKELQWTINKGQRDSNKKEKQERSKSRKANSTTTTLKRGKSFTSVERKKEIEMQAMKQGKKAAVNNGELSDSSTIYETGLIEQQPQKPKLKN